MSKKLKYGNNKQSIEIDDDLKEMLLSGINKTAPIAFSIIKKEIQSREKFAKRNWIVRQKNSKKSIDKFKSAIKIINSGKTIEGSLINTAQYARFIKPGKLSKTESGASSTSDVGEPIVQTTIIEPAEKSLSRLLNDLADSFIEQQKRATK